MYVVCLSEDRWIKEERHAKEEEGHVEELKIKNDSVSTFDAPATANLLILA